VGVSLSRLSHRSFAAVVGEINAFRFSYFFFFIVIILCLLYSFRVYGAVLILAFDIGAADIENSSVVPFVCFLLAELGSVHTISPAKKATTSLEMEFRCLGFLLPSFKVHALSFCMCVFPLTYLHILNVSLCLETKTSASKKR